MLCPIAIGALCHFQTHALQQKKKPYSMTSSAVASSVCGTLRPSSFAVLRLITSSYFVGSLLQFVTHGCS